MAKINSSDISASLAEQMGISKSAAKAYTDFIFEEIKKCVEAGDVVNIKMFGTFKIEATAPRKGRNIRTGDAVEIPSKYKIKFDMSRALDGAYNADSEAAQNE